MLKLYAVLFILFHLGKLLGIINRNGCAPGWDLPAINLTTRAENCYKFKYDANISLNWYEAVRYCENEGAELIVVENAIEAKWVWTVISDPQVDNSPPHHLDTSAKGWFFNVHKLMYSRCDSECIFSQF